MLIRKENKIVRNKSCMRRHFESSGDMIETLDDLQAYLQDLCQGCGFAGDIKSKEGVEGVCDPSEGYTDLDLRVSKLSPRPTIDIFSFDTDKITSTISLTYKKNRWVITDIQENNNQPLGVDCEKFKKDYFAELKKTNGEVIPAVDALRSKYEWLPEKDAMDRERDRIIYQMEHPFGL